MVVSEGERVQGAGFRGQGDAGYKIRDAGCGMGDGNRTSNIER